MIWDFMATCLCTLKKFNQLIWINEIWLPGLNDEKSLLFTWVNLFYDDIYECLFVDF